MGQISTQQRACMGQRRPVQSESGERWEKGGLCEMKGRGKQQQLHCRKNGRKGMRGSERSEGMMTLGAKESLGCNCGSNH